MYRKDITSIGQIKTAADAQRVFQALPPEDRLLMDVYSHSTLGELYLSVMVAHYGVEAALRRIDAAAPPDPYAVNMLRIFSRLEPQGFGRDEHYHKVDGFYSVQFARRRGGAFVGNSENNYFALSDARSCPRGECVGPDDFMVAPWPFADEGAKPVAWVDMYMLDRSVSGSKLRDAEDFITFMMRPETYDMLLLPQDSGIPRYLLPARDDIYSDLAIKSNAKLYAQFRPVIDLATPVTAPRLNDALRAIAGKVDALLAQPSNP